jgi:hypothetical protein
VGQASGHNPSEATSHTNHLEQNCLQMQFRSAKHLVLYQQGMLQGLLLVGVPHGAPRCQLIVKLWDTGRPDDMQARTMLLWPTTPVAVRVTQHLKQAHKVRHTTTP